MLQATATMPAFSVIFIGLKSMAKSSLKVDMKRKFLFSHMKVHEKQE